MHTSIGDTGPQIRLFVGVRPDEETSQLLASFLEKWPYHPALKPTTVPNLHLTVYFFGNVPELALANVTALTTLCARGISPFSLTPDRIQYAPPGQEPRMVWARYQRNADFRAASQAFHSAYTALYPAHQSYLDPIPHITLARLKNGFLPELEHTPVLPGLPANELVLWRSDSTPKGVVYTPLQTWKMGRPR